MTLPKRVLLISVLVFLAMPVWAQVEKVAARTTGISCGSCAAVSEIYLRRIEGVQRVKISMSAEAIMVTYKPGASFDPGAIRDALAQSDVGIVQMQISVRGKVQEIGGKRFFVAGKNKFLLTPNPKVKVPSGNQIIIEGIVKDKLNPMELKALNVKPVKQ